MKDNIIVWRKNEKLLQMKLFNVYRGVHKIKLSRTHSAATITTVWEENNKEEVFNPRWRRLIVYWNFCNVQQEKLDFCEVMDSSWQIR